MNQPVPVAPVKHFFLNLVCKTAEMRGQPSAKARPGFWSIAPTSARSFTRRTSTCPNDKSQENHLVLRNTTTWDGTMALAIFCWAAANLAIATVWTAYCLWPRRDPADASSMDGAHRHGL
jgi:hypothetical protein